MLLESFSSRPNFSLLRVELVESVFQVRDMAGGVDVCGLATVVLVRSVVDA